jgi:hypothetical protein
MAMTGALSIVAPGSPLQMVLAILTSLTFVLLVLKLAPFESNMDDHVSFVSSLALVLATFGGLLLVMDTERKFFHPDTIGTVIIVMTCGVLVFQLGNIVIIKAKVSCGRKGRRGKAGSKGASGDGSSAVSSPRSTTVAPAGTSDGAQLDLKSWGN